MSITATKQPTQKRGSDPKKGLEIQSDSPDQPTGETKPKPTGNDKLAAFEQYSKVIKEVSDKFFPVAEAIWEINDRELYLVKFNTFEECMEAEFGMARTTAYHYMDSHEVKRDLSSIEDIDMPTRDAQVRPLIGVKDAKLRREAWQKAVKSANGNEVTGPLVEAAIAQLDASKGSGKPSVNEKRSKLVGKLKRLLNQAIKADKLDDIKPVLENMRETLKELEGMNAKKKKPKEVESPKDSAP